mmetsp:Transcript_27518/g.27189  ORF Transcript_27518/g.27189 Transcript_27518/m.27189 type:complete len:392 (+) Transcript_27518:6-1181(+)
MAAKIAQISSIHDPKEKVEKYKQLITDLFNHQDVKGSKELISHLLSTEMPLVHSRQVISFFATAMEYLQNAPLIEVANFTLESFGPRSAAFEEEEAKIRDQLAEVYSAKKEYLMAARTLSAINLEGASRTVTADEKADKYIKIAEYFLELEDEASADTFNSKAGMVIHLCQNIQLKLRHRVCHARIQDFKKDFLQASRTYYALSQEGQYGVVESDLLHLLQCAITCAILAKAGPQRSRLLATLYKDERAVHLETYDMLEKLFMERIIKKPDVDRFSEKLQQHHKAKLSSGFTVLETATMEHNIIAISKIYNNITFDELGTVLEIPPNKAENLIANMVQEHRIKAILDQVHGIVEFEVENDGLSEWGGQVESLLQSVEKLVGDIAKIYPVMA